jgi:hypothetical protein
LPEPIYYVPFLTWAFYLLPSFSTVAVVPSFAELLLLEPWLIFTAFGVVIIFRIRIALAGLRVGVGCAELLSAFPTPTSTATSTHRKLARDFQATRENIVTRRIFETPALTPRALLGIF